MAGKHDMNTLREMLVELVFLRIGIVALSGVIFCAGAFVGLVAAAVALVKDK